MGLTTLRARTRADILRAVERSVAEGRHVMVLFDSELEGLHDSFLNTFVEARDPQDLTIMIRGEFVASPRSFFSECWRAMPWTDIAHHKGTTIHALHDVLLEQGEAVARDPTKHTYWIWRNAHILAAQFPGNFRAYFEVFIQDANRVRERGTAEIGGEPPPAPQPVTLLVTALWDALGREASMDSSFLYQTKEKAHGPPRRTHSPTHLTVFRISQ